jgi:hypothetical protein
MVRAQRIHPGISRTVKHVSVIACVFAAGESLTPDVITLQDCASVREQLRKHGVRFGADFALKSNSTPYINAKIVLDYMQTVVFPNLAHVRTLDEFAEEIGVLLMDNCPSHVPDDVIHLLTKARVCVITFARHTTQIFQAFGVLKRRLGYELPFEDENRPLNS